MCFTGYELTAEHGSTDMKQSSSFEPNRAANVLPHLSRTYYSIRSMQRTEQRGRKLSCTADLHFTVLVLCKQMGSYDY